MLTLKRGMILVPRALRDLQSGMNYSPGVRPTESRVPRGYKLELRKTKSFAPKEENCKSACDRSNDGRGTGAPTVARLFRPSKSFPSKKDGS